MNQFIHFIENMIFLEGIEISLSAKLNYQLSNFTSIDKNLHIYNRRKEVNGSKI